MLTDDAVHKPPVSGPYAYYNTHGIFGPDQIGFPVAGNSYVDPIFDEIVRRLTNDFDTVSFSELYTKNGYSNSNGTLTYHRTPSGRNIIDAVTGTLIRANVAFNMSSSFSPVDPDVWFHYDHDSTDLFQYSVATGLGVLLKRFSGPIAKTGGSIDWIDKTGRYFMLNISGATRVWDKQLDVLYTGSIPGTFGGGNGWRAITPDAKYILTHTIGSPNLKHSFAIDHVTKTVNLSPVMFWSLGGGHADCISCTDGKSYVVGFDSNSSGDLYRIDVTLPQSHATAATKQQQRDQNRMLIACDIAHDSGHVSAVATGDLQDWCFASVESGDDTFGKSVDIWRVHMQEIIMVNVLTGEKRRLAHHRSRSTSAHYNWQPRVHTPWNGNVVLWLSNFGHDAGVGYSDLYGIQIVEPALPPDPEPDPPATPIPTEEEMLPIAEPSRNDYIQTVAANRDFTGSFKILDPDAVEVLKNGVTQVRGVDYDIIGTGDNTFTVRYLLAVAIDTKICILRKERPENLSDYVLEGFPAGRVEGDFDKAAMRDQQLFEIVGRALKFAKHSLFKDLDVDDPTDTYFLYKKVGGGFGWAVPAGGGGGGGGDITLPLSVAEGGTGSITADAALIALGLAASAAGRAKIGAAPIAPSYVTIGLDSELANERRLQVGAGLSLVDGGANGDVTLSATTSATARGYLFGLEMTNNAADATNDVDISAGECVSDDALSADRILIALAAFTKQLDAVWAAGSAAGGRIATEALANGVWHCFAFRRSGGADDICFSQTLTPTLPDGGTKKRRIFSLLREGGVIVPIFQWGDVFRRKTPVLTISGVGQAANTWVTRILAVPTGLPVMAIFRIGENFGNAHIAARPLFASDGNPAANVAPLSMLPAGVSSDAAELMCLTDNSGQVQTNADASITVGSFFMVDVGWIDRRGRDA